MPRTAYTLVSILFVCSFCSCDLTPIQSRLSVTQTLNITGASFSHIMHRRLLHGREYLYLAGLNRIDQLDLDLQPVHRLVTGPKNMSLFCVPSIPCLVSECPSMSSGGRLPPGYTQDYCGPRPTDAVVKSWTTDDSVLYACYNVYHGACERLQMLDVSQTLPRQDESIVPVLGSDPKTQAALIVTDDYIFVGTEKDSYDEVTLINFSPLSVRRHNFTSMTKLDGSMPNPIGTLGFYDINLQFRIQYKYMFRYTSRRERPSRHYLYFVMQQPESDKSSDWLTRLGRVCEDDILFYSYVEVTMRCYSSVAEGDNPQIKVNRNGYNLLQTANLTRIGHRLRMQLNSSMNDDPDNEDVLIVVFSSGNAEPTSGASAQTALCLYRMVEVEEVFKRVIQNCNTGFGERGPAHFLNPESPVSCVVDGYMQDLNRYCPINHRPLNWPITGRTFDETLRASPFVVFNGMAVKGLASRPVSIDYSVVVVAGDNGVLYQYEITGRASSRLLSSIRLTDEALRGVQLDQSGHNAYVIARDQVFRVSLFNCSLWSNCTSCLKASDPYCGWCTLQGQCGPREACPQSYSWLSYSDTSSKCPQLAEISPPGIQSSHVDVESGGAHKQHQANPIKLTLRLVNLDDIQYRGLADQLYCAFRTGLAGTTIVRTAAKYKAGGSVTCQTPLIGQLPPVPPNNDFSSVPLVLELNGRHLATGAFYVYDCSRYRDCVHCATSRFDCHWCVTEHSCTMGGPGLAQHCPSFLQLSELVVAPGQGSKCPVFKANTSSLTLASGSSLDIDLQIINVYPVMVRYYCEEQCSGSSVTGRHFPVKQTLHCSFPKIHLNESRLPAVNCSVRVLWDNGASPKRPVTNPDGFHLEVYQCRSLTHFCDDCLDLPERFACGWCTARRACLPRSQCAVAEKFHEKGQVCPDPIITEVHPLNGTVTGRPLLTIRGRNLGRRVKDILGGVFFEGQRRITCDVEPASYLPAHEFQCRLQVTDLIPPDRGYLKVTLVGTPFQTTFSFFQFLLPTVVRIVPDCGPMDGGTLIRIEGSDLDVGSKRRVYLIAPQYPPIHCRIVRESPTNITCITEALRPQRRTRRSLAMANTTTAVRVQLEHDETITISQPSIRFRYMPNPIVQRVARSDIMVSGGNRIEVYGSHFDVIQRPRIVFYYANTAVTETCDGWNATYMVCWSPSFAGIVISDSPLGPTTFNRISYGFIMDNVTSLRTYQQMNVYGDPVVRPFPHHPEPYIIYGGASMFDKYTPELRLEGNFALPATRKELTVKLGEGLICPVTFLADNKIICRLNRSAIDIGCVYPVIIKVGRSFILKPGEIVFQENLDPKWILIIVIPLVIVVVIIFCVLICALLLRNKKQKKRMREDFQHQFIQLESKVAQTCKKAFTELQTDMLEFKQDLAGGARNLPYRDYRTFCLFCLFPEYHLDYLTGHSPVSSHPLMSSTRVPNGTKETMEQGVRIFGQLIRNKQFLLIMIRTMEEETSFSPKDKSAVASLLSAALQVKMEYFTEILLFLLSDLIDRSVKAGDSHNRVRILLRRAESVSEKMLSNWFAFLLYYFLNQRVGEPLFVLYRAILQQVNKGPVDAVTGDAMFSLHSDKLLRREINFKELNLVVVDPDGLFGLPADSELVVRVLDCDTIGQVKDKILDAIYKNDPFTRQRRAETLDLEKLPDNYETLSADRMKSRGHILRNRDPLNHFMSSEEPGFCQLNTLKSYQIGDRTRVALVEIQSRMNTVDRNYMSKSSFDKSGSLKSGTNGSRQFLYSGCGPHLYPSGSLRQVPLSLTTDRLYPIIPCDPIPPDLGDGPVTGLAALDSGDPCHTTQCYHLVLPPSATDEGAATEPGTYLVANGHCSVGGGGRDTRRRQRRRKKRTGSGSRAGLLVNRNLMNMPPEAFLNRALSTKQLLLRFVDQVLEAVFTTVYHNTNLPMCIKYLFDFFDEQALNNTIHDSDVVHIWKSNSLPLRFWVQIVKNLDYLFDIPFQRETAVESCLGVVSQTLIDACSLTREKLTKDSPDSKLLFANDIARYRSLVADYYQDIKRMPAILPQEMNAMLSEHSRTHSDAFNSAWALTELYQSHVDRFYDQIILRLRADPIMLAQKYDQRLAEVRHCLSRASTTGTPTTTMAATPTLTTTTNNSTQNTITNSITLPNVNGSAILLPIGRHHYDYSTC